MFEKKSSFAGVAALTVAGSDSGGGAGIQADLLTFAARGVFGTSAITCLTAQNPRGVSAVEVMPPAFVAAQLERVAAYFDLRAVKTGMLFNEGIIRAVAAFFGDRRHLPLIVDPVMVATSGAVLLEPSAIEALKRDLLPMAEIITPNLDEAGVLLGRQPANPAEMAKAAEALAETYGTAVLLKGGHLNTDELVDVLARPGRDSRAFTHARVSGVNTHGSGCTLSSAIAAERAKGAALEEAVAAALAYLNCCMRQPLSIGGERFLSHG